MSSRGRDPHDGWPASSLLEERPAHRRLRAVLTINVLQTAPQALYPSERPPAKLQARLVFGRWFGVERWSKIACSNRGSNSFEASQNSRLEGACRGHSMAPQATMNS